MKLLRSMLDSAIEAILKGVDHMFNQFRKEIKEGFSKVNSRFQKIETNRSFIKRDVSDLKYDTPTKREFNELKTKVDRYHSMV